MFQVRIKGCAKPVDESITLWKRLKVVNYGQVKGCELGKRRSKNGSCSKPGNEGLDSQLKVFELDPKGNGKPLNDFNQVLCLLGLYVENVPEKSKAVGNESSDQSSVVIHIRYGGMMVLDWPCSKMDGTMWTN